LRADANTGWTEQEARGLLKALGKHGVELVEQPLPVDEDDGLVRLSSESPVALYADESVHDVTDVQRLADAGFRGGFNFKLMKTGGLRPAFRALKEARERGYGTQLGCMLETGLGITAATHFLTLLDHADLDGNVLLKRDPFHGVRPVDGWLRTPAAPGVGAEPTEPRTL
jgi:L-Ala-D/L-Glu epimerase